MDNAFNWVQMHGICSEQDYPYTSGGGVTGQCQKGCSPVVAITGHTDVPQGDENALKAAVSKQPVSVAIEADRSAFQLYKGGILDNAACGTNLDHGVLVVGYDTDSASGKDYWKVKNSWGASWGEQGYIRMVRNKNQCGIASEPSYPTGAKAAGPSPPAPPPPPPSPTPSPVPPPPSPPVPPYSGHYGNPTNGCQKDETVDNDGGQGNICAPKCGRIIAGKCPTDVPPGVLATPRCQQTDLFTFRCRLGCGGDQDCGPDMTCNDFSHCTYNDASKKNNIVV